MQGESTHLAVLCLFREPELSFTPRKKDGGYARDVGVFTAIPGMLIAGPALGYFLGRFAGQKWGHEQAAITIGVVVGFAAAVRQIWLLIKLHGNKK